jgi:cystathionine gamma-lyase
MHRDTQLLHAGHPDHRTPGPYRPGPQFSATYVAPGDPAQHALTYGRFHNPTWTAWEEALGALEGGPAVAFASGMAATAAVFGALLSPGDTVLLPSDSYYTTRVLARDWLERIGVKVLLAPTRDSGQAALVAGARLVWLETPSNPELEICDIQELSTAAHRHGALVAVDNTTATSYLQEPLGLGADLAVASDTKALTGHCDITLGHVAVRDPDLALKLRTWRTQQGAIPGPMEVWLAHRSLATLPLRLRKQCQSAQAIAAWLTQRTEVARVCYPGLATHPGHAVARRQMKGYGPVLSFDVGTRERAERLLERLGLFREATSFGGVHSSAERRARWGGDAVGPGFIRMSVGCEDVNDLLTDLAQALDGAAT